MSVASGAPLLRIRGLTLCAAGAVLPRSVRSGNCDCVLLRNISVEGALRCT